jgi:hypothetical protein
MASGSRFFLPDQRSRYNPGPDRGHSSAGHAHSFNRAATSTALSTFNGWWRSPPIADVARFSYCSADNFDIEAFVVKPINLRVD